MNIVYHGNPGGKGIKTQQNLYKSAMEYINNGKLISSYNLKNKILREGLKEHKCEICGNTE